jgi:LuxR family transcriptional regulator, maltose regulon positive regulatory protein
MSTGNDSTDRATTPSGDPIMTAKFLVPAVTAPVVPRPRLFERLTAGVRGQLTLVSAPAGSGKTVLVSSWVRSCEAPGPVVWISLEEEDQLPGVFWSYVLAGLRRAGVETGRVIPPERTDVVRHALLVALAALLCERPAPVVLVLDNAESLTRQQVFDDLDFLLRHTAGRLRLVLVTRVDPNMALPQYRLEGAVTEVRFAELAFTPEEARPLLAGRRPQLSAAAVAAFSHRTRGWAAGLRLVSVDGSDDGGVDDRADFTGTDIAVYFRHEVLDAQPARVRDVLLATSVVEVLYPELAVALSGLREAGPTLRELAQASVFLDPVPGPGEAYAYHPLVRDLLRAQLRAESPSKVRRLHRKAARWLTDAGRTAEALEQSAAADDWEAAAELLVVSGAVGPMLVAASPGIGEVFARMPAGTPGPAAAVAAGAAAVLLGDLDATEKHLRRAEELVGAGPATDAALPLALAVTAAARAALAGDADEALAGAGAVQDLLAGEPTTSAPAAAALALFAAARARLIHGDFADARGLFTTALEAEEPGSAGSGAVRAGDAWRRHLLAQLALVEAADGRLEAAARAAGAALDGGADVTDHQPAHVGLAAAHVSLAWVAADRGELERADEHVRAARACAAGWPDPVCAAALALVRSRLLRLGGDRAGALRLLALWRDRRSARTPSWLALHMDAAEARALVADGRPDAAESLLRGSATQGAPECLLAHGWAKLATGGAAESWRTARQVSRMGAVPLELLVEANLLGSAGALALSRPEAAAASVDEALRLASAEGLRRPFEEAPARLRAVLSQREHHRRAEGPRRPEAPRRPEPAGRAQAPGTSPAPPSPALPVPRSPAAQHGPNANAPAADAKGGVIIQPLTERELEVLIYLDQLLPTDEIAARMFVSVNTVKTHVRAVLRKLAAERRNDAVRRARELGLV